MKRLTKSLLSLILTLLLLFSYTLPCFSVEVAAATETYSKTSNSGERDEICLSLDGTSADSYYTGSYTYDNLEDMSSSALKSALHSLMTTTHKKTSSYDDCHYKADKTDCENNNGKVSLIYTSYEATMQQWNGWNREHVWPKSLGGDTTTGGGADLHHIRPSDASVNSARNNRKYGNVNGGTASYGNNPAVDYLGGHYLGNFFEPLDNVKGDVARICLYVHVRWGSAWGASNITSVFQSVDVLLEWCELDPVDTWEMGRNEVIQDIQGNRNVFIDYPELAWLIFDREVPTDMTTPSGEAKNNGGDTPIIPTHKCESICITCGLCLDTSCTDSACATKCQGHVVTPTHKCESICITCGLCLDTSCTDSACATKCQGHAVTPTHKCESICITCGLCLDMSCTDSACASKCQGHVVTPTHKCESICATCGLCLDTSCTESACSSKCKGHTPPCDHTNQELRNKAEPTCVKNGYSGDLYCLDCGKALQTGSMIAATGNHNFSDWVIDELAGEKSRNCEGCGKTEVYEIQDQPSDPPVDPPVSKPNTPEELVGTLDSDADKILIFLILGTTEQMFIESINE